jgi:hypothetical protein
MRFDVKRAVRWSSLLAGVALAATACGDLDDVTRVHDLRVLAVAAEPPGFLVPLDSPMSIPETEATLTALVVDPQMKATTLKLSAEACPDYIDTITAASGKNSKLCPTADVTNKLPPPLDTALATKALADGASVAPAAPSTIEYAPSVKYGLTKEQVALFFSPTPSGSPAIDQSIAYNRDFSMDAIVSFDFVLGDEKASAIKRIVYWPELAAADVSADAIHPKMAGDPPDLDCPAGHVQVANKNPVLDALDFYRHRVEGEPQDPYAAAEPTLSLAANDELYVQPVWDPASIEKYFLRHKNAELGKIVTECHHELLTFQFYATAGSFGPQDRQTELPPLFDRDSVVRTESRWNPPKAADLPADGKVTVWVTARDERAGVGWKSRTFKITP